MSVTKRIPTGNPILDTLLGGGIPSGTLTFIAGAEGAGATEFVFTLLHGIARTNRGNAIRFATALRAPTRAEREAHALFEGSKDASRIEFQAIPLEDPGETVSRLLTGLRAGDILVLESASALVREGGAPTYRDLLVLGDRAAKAEVAIFLLYTAATLPPEQASGLSEAADGVLTFDWREGSGARRRILKIERISGFPPTVEGEQIPIYEVAIHRGSGVTFSRVKTVV